jgi:4-hydroxy-3-methylbut-2-enyl diphosphate reductase
MKFTSAAVLLCASVGTTSAFAPIATMTQHTTTTITTQLYSTTEEETAEENRVTKKEDRLQFMKSEQFHRRGFKEVREKVEASIQSQFQSELVDDLKTNNFVIDKDGVKVYLAKVCFCICACKCVYIICMCVCSLMHAWCIYLLQYILLLLS